MLGTVQAGGLIGALALAVLTLALAACGGGQGPAAISVRLDPSTVKAQTGQEVVVTVKVSPEGRAISGGEISLSFNPGVLSLVSVVPGDLLGPSPLIGTETVDSQAGTLLYALARKGATTVPTAASDFARITFRVASDAPSGQYPLALTSVGLADESFRDIRDISLGSATVEVQ